MKFILILACWWAFTVWYALCLAAAAGRKRGTFNIQHSTSNIQRGGTRSLLRLNPKLFLL